MTSAVAEVWSVARAADRVLFSVLRLEARSFQSIAPTRVRNENNANAWKCRSQMKVCNGLHSVLYSTEQAMFELNNGHSLVEIIVPGSWSKVAE